MSQKKVDAYKQQKANRKEILKKEKRMLMIEKMIGIVICFAAACWVGYSVYDKVTDTSGKEIVKVDTVIDTSALNDYTSSLDTEDDSLEVETAEDAETEADAAAEETTSVEETADDTVEEASEAGTTETEEQEAAEQTTQTSETEAAEDKAE